MKIKEMVGIVFGTLGVLMGAVFLLSSLCSAGDCPPAPSKSSLAAPVAVAGSTVHGRVSTNDTSAKAASRCEEKCARQTADTAS